MSQFNIQAPEVLVRPTVNVYQEGQTILPQPVAGVDPGIDFSALAQPLAQIGQTYQQYKQDILEQQYQQQDQTLREYLEGVAFDVELASARGEQDKIPALLAQGDARINQFLEVDDYKTTDTTQYGRFKQALLFAARNGGTKLQQVAQLEEVKLARADEQAAIEQAILNREFQIKQEGSVPGVRSKLESLRSALRAYGVDIPDYTPDFVGPPEDVRQTQYLEDLVTTLPENLQPDQLRKLQAIYPKLLDLTLSAQKQMGALDEAYAKQLEAERKQFGERAANDSLILIASADDNISKVSDLTAQLAAPSLSKEDRQEFTTKVLSTFATGIQNIDSFYIGLSRQTGIPIGFVEDENGRMQLDIPTFLSNLNEANIIPQDKFDNIAEPFKKKGKLTEAMNKTILDTYNAGITAQGNTLKRRNAELVAQAETQLAGIDANTRIPDTLKPVLKTRILEQLGRDLQSIISGPIRADLFPQFTNTTNLNGTPFLLASEQTVDSYLTGFTFESAVVPSTGYNSQHIEIISNMRVGFEKLLEKHVGGTSQSRRTDALRQAAVSRAIITGDGSKLNNKPPTRDEITTAIVTELNQVAPLIDDMGNPLGVLQWLESVPQEQLQNVNQLLVAEYFGVEIQNIYAGFTPDSTEVTTLNKLLDQLGKPTNEALRNSSYRIQIGDVMYGGLKSSMGVSSPTPATYWSFVRFPVASRDEVIRKLESEDEYQTDTLFRLNVQTLARVSKGIGDGGDVTFDTVKKFLTPTENQKALGSTLGNRKYIDDAIDYWNKPESTRRQITRTDAESDDLVRSFILSGLASSAELQTLDIFGNGQTDKADSNVLGVIKEAARHAFAEVLSSDTDITKDAAEKFFNQYFNAYLQGWSFQKYGEDSKTIRATKRVEQVTEVSDSHVTSLLGTIDPLVVVKDANQKRQLVLDTFLQSSLGNGNDQYSLADRIDLFKTDKITAGDPVGAALALSGMRGQQSLPFEIKDLEDKFAEKNVQWADIMTAAFMLKNNIPMTRYEETLDRVKSSSTLTLFRGGVRLTVEGRDNEKQLSVPIKHTLMKTGSVVPTIYNGLSQENTKQTIIETVRKGIKLPEPLVEQIRSMALEEPVKIDVDDTLRLEYFIENDRNGNAVLYESRSSYGPSRSYPMFYGKTWNYDGKKQIDSRPAKPSQEFSDRYKLPNADAVALNWFKDNPTKTRYEKLGSKWVAKMASNETVLVYTKKDDGSVLRTVEERSYGGRKLFVTKVLSKELVVGPSPKQTTPTTPAEPQSAATPAESQSAVLFDTVNAIEDSFTNILDMVQARQTEPWRDDTTKDIRTTIREQAQTVAEKLYEQVANRLRELPPPTAEPPMIPFGLTDEQKNLWYRYHDIRSETEKSREEVRLKPDDVGAAEYNRIYEEKLARFLDKYWLSLLNPQGNR